MQSKILLTSIIQFLTFLNCYPQISDEIFIRLNQVGFQIDDVKTGIIFSESPLHQEIVNVRKVSDEKIIFSAAVKLKGDVLTGDQFNNIASFDISGLKVPGEYFIEYSGINSYPFKIDDGIYNHVVDSLLLFFKVQRCGPTNPYLHSACHLLDVSKIFGRTDSSMVDLTGGWHDAGDYIKFLSSTCYATYLLLFSYEFDKIKFGFDHDNNGTADVLDEAKIGLDWLLRCNYNGDTLALQVQDTSDHSAGWRLPENDTLRYNRVGFTGIAKNIIGLYSAVLSLANRIWKKDVGDELFANKCLETAIKFYSLKDYALDVDSSNSKHYMDNNFYGKLALGAVELYETIGEDKFLEDAKAYSDSAGPDFWWSWGNMNALAHYKIAKFDITKIEYIRSSLDYYSNNMITSSFDEPLNYSWGTTNSFLGTALTEILYRSLTNDDYYEKLSATQRDFILGRNKWGLSFISGIGKVFPKHIHSQIALYYSGNLPGALVGGPAPTIILEQFNLNKHSGIYSNFSDDVQYSDERLNFITNEATIVGNSTALFVIGYYSNR